MSSTPAENRPKDATEAPAAIPAVASAAVSTDATADSPDATQAYKKNHYNKPQGRFPVPTYSPYNQGYYYPNAPGFGYPQPFYPGAQAPNAYTPQYQAPKVTIKSKDGQTVNFQPPATSANSTPTAADATLVEKTEKPEAPVAPKASDDAKSTFLEQFKKQLEEKKRRKEAEEAAKNAPKEAPQEKAEEKTEVPAEIPAEEPEVAEDIERAEESEVAIKKPASDEVLADATEAADATETVDATETADATDAADVVDAIIEEPVEPDFGITKYFEQIERASLIANPFKHTYPEGFTGPDPKLLEGNTGKSYRYDPVFLFQFQEAVNFQMDKAWREKYSQLIVIPDRSQTPSDRSFSRNNSRFNQQGGLPMRHSSNNLRGQQFDQGSRQNSRTNSKRKPNNRDRSSRTNRTGSRRDRDDQPREDEKPAEPVKPLEKTANRWVPKSRAAKTEVKYAPDGVTVLYEGAELASKIKSYLNKLTLEKFDSISDEILAVANQSQWEEDASSLKHVVELIFAKATDEPHWSSMYAKLIAKMCTVIGDEVKDTTVVNREGAPLSGGQLARKCLLTRCQSEYEKGWSDKLPTNEDGTPIEPELMSDEYYAAAAAKRRGLGLVKFIGELYILGLLSDKIVFVCLDGQSKNVEDPSEDTLENLAQLLQTVGKRLEANNNLNVLNTVFDRIAHIIEHVKIPSRIKFMLMDLQDLRRAKWSGVNDNKGPKTIAEIHDDAERKKAEDERAKEKRRRQPDSRQNSSRQNSSWGGNRVSSTELKNFGVVRNSERSGPMNSFNKSKSSRDSKPKADKHEEVVSAAATPVATRENSKRAEPVASNMFAALSMGEDAEHTEEVEEPAEAVAEESQE